MIDTSYNNVGKYLQKVNETFKNTENKSLTDILESFRLVSEEYHNLSNKEQKFEYSSYNFNECPGPEKVQFANDQLQFIETLVIDRIYEKVGNVVNWWDIYKLLYDPVYARTEKGNRHVVYSTASNNRPIGDVAYNMWNGLQIIDLDIKDAEITTNLKQVIFDELKKYNWFLGVCRSASGKGLHVWTKIRPISIEFKNRKVEYLCNFRHKYSYVYIILTKYASKFGYTKDDILRYLDLAMAKPQQGIFISSDQALMNTNFKDQRLDVNFETAFDTGIESINWITHPDLKEVFSKLEWFTNENFDKDKDVEVANLEHLLERDTSRSNGKRHYKHAQRWQLANTLTNIYGPDKALEILIDICQGTEIKELKGDVRTASIHHKPISIWAVTELNKRHGFKIEIKGSDTYKEELEKVEEEIKTEDNTIDPTKVLNDKTPLVRLHLNANQYLSDIKDDILKNLSHITLLEAGAGYGKTEMIKAFKSKTLLILPFTSTIKAKVEASETTSDWLYYYGNKRPTLDELLGTHSMSMTIDKFSHLNVQELDTANFEYIVIDESHLLFTSSYRDVMSPCIQRLANCKAKIIMMTGTPTGEILFFPNIKHIKVVKDDTRIKKFELHMCPTSYEQMNDMCAEMAKDIIEGKKILYPTNKGNLYFDQITGLIQQNLNIAKFGRELKAFYYKKSNYGDDSMDNININKSIGENDIVFCTTYLSVGVDICDRSTFSVYFNELWIPQDIEQFANRLRNNDLYLKLFLPKKDDNGPINYYHTQPLDLSFNEQDLMLARNLIKTCNDVLERNQEESKYNPIIQSLLGENRFLKYDENDCKYYIDETTYKLKIFEERYSEYSKQLPVLLQGITYYGYVTEVNDSNKEIPEANKKTLDDYLKGCKRLRYNYVTDQTFKFLEHINDDNIDLYRQLLKGNYEIFKDDKYQEVRGENGLYVESIEIMEKNTPIVLGLYRFYDCETIVDIYKFCTDKKSNRINFSKLNRIRKFVVIENNIQKKRMDFPTYKFVKEAQQWARKNPQVTGNDINVWCSKFAVAYANSIRGLIVDDNRYLDEMFELTKELFDVVIIKSRPSKGIISITPFELEWERKDVLEDIYGTRATKEFFLQELIDEMKKPEEDEEEVLDALPVTEKDKLDDVKDELPNVIHKEYDYFVYSELDKSNERFLRKQENTDKSKEYMWGEPTVAPTKKPLSTEPDLFSEVQNESEQSELPF